MSDDLRVRILSRTSLILLVLQKKTSLLSAKKSLSPTVKNSWSSDSKKTKLKSSINDDQLTKLSPNSTSSCNCSNCRQRQPPVKSSRRLKMTSMYTKMETPPNLRLASCPTGSSGSSSGSSVDGCSPPPGLPIDVTVTNSEVLDQRAQVYM